MKPLCMGVTGCIGSGKTTVTALLSRITGFYPVNLDHIGHQAYANEEIRKQIREHFSLEEPDSREEAIRSKIGSLVFHSEVEKRWLENLLWPFIIQETKKIVTAHQKCILDGIILYPSGLDQFCSCILKVQTKKSLLKERLVKKGYSLERLNRILATQISMLKPVGEKQIPQMIVRNDTTMEELFTILTLLWKKKLRFFFEEEERAETRP